MDDTPAGYQVISLDGRAIAGAMTMGEEFPAEVPTNWLPYFVVSNAQAASDSAIELGGGVQVPPFDTPMGPMAVLADPTGAVFAVAAMAQVDDPNDWPT